MLDIAIVGGGPAGLMAAEAVAGQGRSVTVFEGMPSLGRKLLMAGRGGLNLTHGEVLEALLGRYGEAEEQLAPLIRRFDNTALRAWCEALGQPTFVGSSGRIFPTALKSSPLLRAWLGRLSSQGVGFATRHRWQGFTADGGLRFSTPDGGDTIVAARAVILALGGASWPRLGADGSWATTLREAGVVVRELQPANAGVMVDWSSGFAERFAGTPLKTVVASLHGERHRGDLVVSAAGIEGGPIYVLGPRLRPALARGGAVRIELDLKPDATVEGLGAKLAKAIAKGRSRSNALRQAGLAPVASALLREAVNPLPASAVDLAALAKALPLDVKAMAGLERAISTAGGIALDELDEALMVKRLPGVFVAGEMLDWEAPTGGYLLQACFATGVRAGEGVLAWLEGVRGA